MNTEHNEDARAPTSASANTSRSAYDPGRAPAENIAALKRDGDLPQSFEIIDRDDGLIEWSINVEDMFAGLGVDWPGEPDVTWGNVAANPPEDHIRNAMILNAAETFHIVRECALVGVWGLLAEPVV